MESAEDETTHGPAPETARLSSEAASRYAALRSHSIRFEDAIDPNAERVEKLRKNDIIFGRGKGFQNHPGNQRMREIIDKYKIQYHSLKRAEKRQLVEKVYKEIAEGGARFLKKVDGEIALVMVDAPVAIQKVSQTLRRRKNAEMHQADSASGGLDNVADNYVTATGFNPCQQAALQILNNNSAVVYGTGGTGPSLATLYNGANGNPALGMGMLGSTGALTGLEASQLAGLHGSRFGGLGSLQIAIPSTVDYYKGLGSLQLAIPSTVDYYKGLGRLQSAIPSTVDYYNHMRRQQLVRDQMILPQMEGATAMLNSARIGAASSSGAQGALFRELQRSVPDAKDTNKKEGNDGRGSSIG
jgi:hypothetical protein